MLGTFPPLFHLLPLPHLPTAQKEKLSPSAESQKSAVCLHPCHRWLQGPSPHCPCSHTMQHRLFLPHSLEATTRGLCQHCVTCQRPEVAQALPTAPEPGTPRQRPFKHMDTEQGVCSVGAISWAPLLPRQGPHSGLRLPTPPKRTQFSFYTKFPRTWIKLGVPAAVSVSQQQHKQPPRSTDPAALGWEEATPI